MNKENKLIAEFMGHSVSHGYVQVNSDGTYKGVEKYWSNQGVCGKYGHYEVWKAGYRIPIKYLSYHDSWDWLMPVAIKIAKKYSLDCIAKRYDIDDVYQEVLRAIKFINDKDYYKNKQA